MDKAFHLAALDRRPCGLGRPGNAASCRIRGLAAWFPYRLDAAITPPALGLGPAANGGVQEQKNRPARWRSHLLPPFYAVHFLLVRDSQLLSAEAAT